MRAAPEELGVRLALRAGWVASGVLVLSGVLYGVAWLVVGDEWAGPTSLRKPILFGLSTGVTLASVTWVASATQRRRGDAGWFCSLVVALLLEVLLIDLQQARGVPSHFNRATELDAAITSAMGVLILWATLVIAGLTVRAFRALRLEPDDARAARAGLVLLLVSCVLGAVITAVGEGQQARGLAPEVYGEAGVLKFAHGLPLHAIQLLAGQAWLLRRLGVRMSVRVRALDASIVGLTALTVYGGLQTALGAPRVPPEGPAWVPFSVAIIAFGVAAFSSARDAVVRARAKDACRAS